MNCILQNEIIDNVLDSFRADLGKDFEQYRNHVYRVYNLAIIRLTSEDDIRTMSIAAAYHDLGIWTGHTFDYLKPSISLAGKYCLLNGIDQVTQLNIETITNEHHKLSRIANNDPAEIFRQADLADLTLGWRRHGMDRDRIRELKRTFPNRGFHLNLGKLFLKNLFVNPLRPLPMYKW